MLSNFNYTVTTNFAINAISQFPRTHYSIVPAFQYPNWGEAPNLVVENLVLWAESEKSDPASGSMTLNKIRSTPDLIKLAEIRNKFQ